jgi:hypothetical protein
MADDFDFGDKKRNRKEDQENSGIIHRQCLHGKKGQNQGNAAYNARQNDTGIGKFKIEPGQPQ